MATASVQGKCKEASFRILFKNLQKSKINSRGQDEALRELACCFYSNSQKRNEAGFKQALANTARWYENNRRHLDRAILGLGLQILNEVFIENGYSSLAEAPSLFAEEERLLEKVRLLSNNNQNEEALSLLKTMEPKVEEAMQTPHLFPESLVAAFFTYRGTCFANLKLYHLAIEDYSQCLARTAKFKAVMSLKEEIMYNFKEVRKDSHITQTRRGTCYFCVGYYEEAKSDLKIIMKKPSTPIDLTRVKGYFALCNSFLELKRYKHALHAAYLLRFYAKKLGMQIEWSNTNLLAMCLYKDKKFVQANWILSDLILECQDDKSKINALELNGHILMEMNKYAEAMKNFNQAYELSPNFLGKSRIHFAMYKYACEAQDMVYLTDLRYLILPWRSYFPISLLKEESFFTTFVKFVIEKSIQALKPFKSEEEVQNHLMYCNSVMLTKLFKK